MTQSNNISITYACVECNTYYSSTHQIYICISCNVIICEACCKCQIEQFYCNTCDNIYNLTGTTDIQHNCTQCINCPFCIDNILNVQKSHDNDQYIYVCRNKQCNYQSDAHTLPELSGSTQIALESELQSRQQQLKYSSTKLFDTLLCKLKQLNNDNYTHYKQSDSFRKQTSGVNTLLQSLEPIEHKFQHYSHNIHHHKIIHNDQQPTQSRQYNTTILQRSNNYMASSVTDTQQLLPSYKQLQCRLTQRCYQCNRLVIKHNTTNIKFNSFDINTSVYRMTPTVILQQPTSTSAPAFTMTATLINHRELPVTVSINNDYSYTNNISHRQSSDILLINSFTLQDSVNDIKIDAYDDTSTVQTNTSDIQLHIQSSNNHSHHSKLLHLLLTVTYNDGKHVDVPIRCSIPSINKSADQI